jgi:hypothetical protein
VRVKWKTLSVCTRLKKIWGALVGARALVGLYMFFEQDLPLLGMFEPTLESVAYYMG